MKHVLKTAAVAFICAGMLFTACKKKDDTTSSISDSTALANNADDETSANSEHDDAIADADNAMNASGLAGGRTEQTVCGAAIDSTVNGQRTITFDGITVCGVRGVKRSGSIVLKLVNGAKWRDAGAVLSVTLNNYTVTKKNGAVTTLNGSGKVYNVLGGLRKQLGSGGVSTIQHRIRFSGLTLTHNNKTFNDWGIAKTRTLSGNGDLYSITITGDTTLGGNQNVATWGTGRYGETFYTRFTTPIQANSSCGWASPTAGVKLHQGLRRSLTVTFGVDASGNPVSTGCPEYYKWDFQGISRSYTGVVKYNP